ncbi:hypothetical protein SAMN05444397_102426 [Flavobacterium aquidurense]|uniref:Lipoprotein n=1 Tax=Flavobacterium frigidimaris TaxID=262320 RepID=A0ABX4BMQ8_FLAFR|nr:hypothetical protein [Flavobacterium frigidimaris]OXA77678.1 hypothetical protein B0A65_15175 [Flavobacterium frigidimaris]SDY85249.1 hypothetical protein SAMN05444397_102426 [Flavobacterium aquidurense]
MKKKVVIIFLALVLIISGKFLFQKWYFNSDRIHERQEETWNERISNYKYVEYIPIVFQQDELIDARDLLSKTHVKNVIHVLMFYNEEFKVQKGKLLVSSKIDRKTLWNYTTKANDSVWLVEHQIEKQIPKT